VKHCAVLEPKQLMGTVGSLEVDGHAGVALEKVGSFGHGREVLALEKGECTRVSGLVLDGYMVRCLAGIRTCVWRVQGPVFGGYMDRCLAGMGTGVGRVWGQVLRYLGWRSLVGCHHHSIRGSLQLNIIRT
jgi:hypothetical protein